MKKIMPLEQILAENLTEAMRRTVGLETIDKLSARSGVGRGTIDRLKKGEVSTKIETVEKLAAALGVSPVQLLTAHDNVIDAAFVDVPPSEPPALARLERTSEDEAQMLAMFREMSQEKRAQALGFFEVMVQQSRSTGAANEPQIGRRLLPNGE